MTHVTICKDSVQRTHQHEIVDDIVTEPSLTSHDTCLSIHL